MGEIQTQFSILEELERACKIIHLEIRQNISKPMDEEVTDFSTIFILFLQLLLALLT